MLSRDELQTIIAEMQEKAQSKATSRMTGPTPKQQGAIKKEKPAPKPKGTAAKSSTAGKATPAKTTSPAVPSVNTQVKQEHIQTREPKGPPAPRLQTSSSGLREQSNPRGITGRTESGWVNTMQRGRMIGQGTPSVAPDQAKGGLPMNPQRVETPPRSRSEERGEGVSGREDTPPRSRSTERSDGSDGGTPPVLQPTPRAPSSIGWLSRPRSLERDTPREPSVTSEGLGPIIIGASGGNAPDPIPSSGTRASSLNPIRRAISAITGRGRDPQPPPPRRGREPTRDGQPPPDDGGGYSDTSSYVSDIQRSDESPEGFRPPPVVAVRIRPHAPPPPQFHDTLYVGALSRNRSV